MPHQIAIQLPASAVPSAKKDPDEVLRGALAIGAELGLDLHKANYHLKKGHVRGAYKFGRGWIGVRREILQTALLGTPPTEPAATADSQPHGIEACNRGDMRRP
jgi:hypothetical protein